MVRSVEASLDGMKEAQADLTDYLQRIGIRVTSTSSRAFILLEDRGIAQGAFKREVGAGSVSLSASDTRGLWAGIVYMEKELSTLGVPSLPIGTVERVPAWNVQIGQAPYGANYLVPDLRGILVG